MQEIIDEIERAATRCKMAATELKSPFINAARKQDSHAAMARLVASLIKSGDLPKSDESLIQRAHEAIAAFDNVRVRIIPLLEALPRNDEHAGLCAKLSAIQMAVLDGMAIDIKLIVRKEVNTMIAEYPQWRSHKLRLWAFMDSIADVLYAGILAIDSLPELSEDLTYIGMYFKGKNAQARPFLEASAREKGDIVMGSKITNHISATNLGAFSQGDGAVVTGNISINKSSVLTQENHKRAITKAQDALNADQDALARIDERLYEALGQFLRMARQIQVDQANMADIQAKMKATFDEVWAEQKAKGMKEFPLPQGLEVIKELAGNEVMVEVLKKLLGL